ncbi:MAG TPA: carbohydrate porin, partial [Thermoanaerobaculia bacterium]
RVFADFTDKENQDKFTDVKSNDSGTGIDVKRFYVGISHSFDSVWSASFVSDIGDQGAKRYDVFVKNAYIQAKFAPEATFRLGAAGSPWVPYVEDNYGFRYVENTPAERAGLANSADWGVHFLGKTAGDTNFNYQVSVVNGRGYSNPTRSKGVDVEGRLGFQLIPGLQLGIGGLSGKRGLDTDAVPAQHTASRFDALAAYTNEGFRIGGEYFTADNYNNVTSPLTDKADGFGTWISFAFTPVTSVFGRYDEVKPSKDLKPNLKDTYFNVGVQFKINAEFAASLAYKYEKVEGGTFSGTNGTVGSVNAGSKGEYNEFGIWTIYNF